MVRRGELIRIEVSSCASAVYGNAGIELQARLITQSFDIQNDNCFTKR